MNVIHKVAVAFLILLLLQTEALAANSYFPRGIFSSNNKIDVFLADKNSMILKSFGEQPLHKLKCYSCVELRLLWDRGIKSPVLIRIDIKSDSDGTLVKKTMMRADHIGYLSLSEPLSEEQIHDLRMNLAGINIKQENHGLPNSNTLDADIFFLEVATDGEYGLRWRVNIDWENDEVKFRELCLNILDMAGINLESASQASL